MWRELGTGSLLYRLNLYIGLSCGMTHRCALMPMRKSTRYRSITEGPSGLGHQRVLSISRRRRRRELWKSTTLMKTMNTIATLARQSLWLGADVDRRSARGHSRRALEKSPRRGQYEGLPTSQWTRWIHRKMPVRLKTQTGLQRQNLSANFVAPIEIDIRPIALGMIRPMIARHLEFLPDHTEALERATTIAKRMTQSIPIRIHTRILLGI